MIIYRIRYLKCTEKVGLVFNKNSGSFHVDPNVDSGYASDMNEKKVFQGTWYILMKR